MRRLVAVFSSKRDNSKSTPSHPPQNSRLLHLPLSLAFSSSHPAPSPSSITSTPQLSSISDHGLSSDSSTRSASVYAPAAEDNRHAASLSRNSTKRSWKNWLGGKRVSSDPPTLPEHPIKPLEPPPHARTERPSSFQVLSRSSRQVDDTEKQYLEEEHDDTVSLTHSDPALSSTTKPFLVTSPAKAQQNLKLLIKNSLIPPFSSSPFVQPSPAYLFPLSCNRPQALPSKVDMRRVALKRRLLERLERHSVDDEAVISAFGPRSLPATTPAPILPDYEACFPPNTTLVFRASPGLRRWISRPCFEDRFSVFLPSNDGLCQTPVTGTLAVAALEYSESLDILADPDFDPALAQPVLSQDALWEPSQEGLPKTSPPLAEKASPPATVKSRHSFILSPSPLRNQHNSDSVPSSVAPDPTSAPRLSVPASDRRSSLSRSQSPQPTPASPTAQHSVLAPVVKRAVRFADDDAEDVEPLHLLRQKKMREEKAKFLRAEKRRRLMQQEQERRRIEAERIEEEKRRWVREKEKKELEQRQYAEMVAAQRARRESQRAGIIPGLKMDDNHVLLPSTSSLSLRDTERNQSHNTKKSSLLPGPSSLASRRGASESSLSPSQASLFETSSHRGGSIGYSPSGSNSGQGYQSRPSSTYSSSSDGRRSGRQSKIPNNPNMPFMDRAASYPMWSASNQSIHSTPSVTPYPELMNDSLLLPPSAPFMMHQRSRQSRNSSPGRSHSSGSLNANSASSSSERVNMHRQSTSRSPDAYLTPSPGASPGKLPHTRPGRNDSRNFSGPAPVPSHGPAHHTRPPNLPSLQLPQVAQYTQSPTPWTALPTERGNLPTAMPVSPYSHSLGTAMNRGTNVSFTGPIASQNMKKNHRVKR